MASRKAGHDEGAAFQGPDNGDARCRPRIASRPRRRTGDAGHPGAIRRTKDHEGLAVEPASTALPALPPECRSPVPQAVRHVLTIGRTASKISPQRRRRATKSHEDRNCASRGPSGGCSRSRVNPEGRHTRAGSYRAKRLLAASWLFVALRLLCGEILLPCLPRREFPRSYPIRLSAQSVHPIALSGPIAIRRPAIPCRPRSVKFLRQPWSALLPTPSSGRRDLPQVTRPVRGLAQQDRRFSHSPRLTRRYVAFPVSRQPCAPVAAAGTACR